MNWCYFRIFCVLLILYGSQICWVQADSENGTDTATVDLFSKAERLKLDQLRARVNDSLTDEVHELDQKDEGLIRWLQVRDMNVEHAAEMFLEYLKWRKHNRINTIQNETILEFNPPVYNVGGHDRDGYPILIVYPTAVDLRKLIIQGLKSKAVRYWFQMLERAGDAIVNSPKTKDGRRVTRLTVVLDMQGYNAKQHFCLDCLSVYKDWFVGLESYYPNGLRHFIIINMSRVAKQWVELIKPFLSTNSQRALKVFEPNRKEWTAYLLKIIPADQLPYRFGGTKLNPSLVNPHPSE